MARARERVQQHSAIAAAHDQPLIAVPRDDGTVVYYTSEEAADAERTDETLREALNTAGALSDLSWEEAEAELERIRHEGSTSSHAT